MKEIGSQQLLVILAVLVSNIAVTMWWFGWPRPVAAFRTWLTATRLRAALGLTFACVALWVAIFVIYRFPVTGDLVTGYLPGGREVMAGQIPDSPYMPGFLYIVGIIDFLFPFELTFPLFFALCFALASGLAIWLFSRVLPSELVAGMVVVGFLNGAAWLYAIGHQQDEALMLLFAVATMSLLARGNNLQAGLVGGLGLICTKTTFLVFLLPLLFQSSRPRKFVEGGLLTGGLGLGLFILVGFDLKTMLIHQAHQAGDLLPPSLPNLLVAFTGVNITKVVPGFIFNASILALCLLVAIFLGLGMQKSNPLYMARAVAAVWIVFLLFATKSLPLYRLCFLPFLPVILQALPLRRVWMIVSFIVYGTALGVQLLLFDHMIGRYDLFVARHLTDMQSLGRFAFMLSIDATILLLEVVWLVFCLRARRVHSEISRGYDTKVAVVSTSSMLPAQE